MNLKNVKSLVIASTLLFSQMNYAQSKSSDDLLKLYKISVDSMATIENQIKKADDTFESVQFTKKLIVEMEEQISNVETAMKYGYDGQQYLYAYTNALNKLKSELNAVNEQVCLDFAGKCRGITSEFDATSNLREIRASLKLDAIKMQKLTRDLKQQITDIDPNLTNNME